MKTKIKPVCLILTTLLLATVASAQTFTLLKTLNPNANSTGLQPEAPLVQGPDNTLYGTASSGGVNASGVVFKIRPDGTGFTVIKNFSVTDPSTGTNDDGANPYAGLVLSGNTLYGTTVGGGGSSNGVVFSVRTDGSGFTNLHNFNGQNDGANPYGGLVLSGNTLYGTTYGGGGSGNGTVFSINTNGGNFTNLYNFSGSDDGANPQAGLILSGSILYGTAENGGVWDWGTVFAINTNGGGFTNIYSFDFDGGANPYAELVLSGNTLYGTTENGGSDGWGTVFTVAIGGGGFNVLKNFTGGSDGGNPYGGLVLAGDILYGTAESGGGANPESGGGGTVFGVRTNGIGFLVVKSFTNGGGPFAGLLFSGSTLYGTTPYGGSSGNGTVFKINTDRSDFAVLENFSAASGEANPRAGLLLSGGTLYGTASGGTVFSLNTDGSGFSILYSFNGSNGGDLQAGLVLSGSSLYGTTENGGLYYGGTVFAVNTNGSGFTNLHNFSRNDGVAPQGSLALSGNTLYGTTYNEGSGGYGTVFSLNTDGSGFTILHSFNGSDGGGPLAGLVLSGSTLYGTTAGGYYDGTVFAINTNGSGFTNLHTFDYSDGDAPEGGLVLLDGTLYGTTANGGISGNGTVFAVNTNGSSVATNGITNLSVGFTNLYNFTATSGLSYPSTNSDGAHPGAGLVAAGNTLYGTTEGGGSAGNGTVFSLNTDGTGFINLYNFTVTSDLSYPSTNSDGATPDAGLVLSGGTLYGTTMNGGDFGVGTVFALGLPDFVLFTANPTSGVVPLPVQFASPNVDNNGHTITNWNWNFGDGSSSTAQNPLHTYTTAGTFSPSLVAANDIGMAVPGLGPPILANSLVVNSGFETGTFNGWTISGDFTYTSVGTGALYAYSGMYGAQLGTTGALGFLSQTLPTTAGGNYLLSCWLDSPDGLTPNQFLVSWDGATLFDQTNIAAIGWTNLQFTVTATGPATVLEFGFRDDATYLGLDDISVTPIVLPQPDIVNIVLSGGNLVLNGTSGVSGRMYYVLANTKLTLPLSQWSRIATNVLSTNGNFSLTVINAVDSNMPSRYFMLSGH